MPRGDQVKGLDTVLSNLNSEIAKIEGASMDGLMEAGMKIQASSQQRAPVDTGNLKGSAYTRKARVGGKSVEIGYTANYAIYVHENLEARHTVGQAKFLESALRDNEAKIIDIVQQKAKVE